MHTKESWFLFSVSRCRTDKCLDTWRPITTAADMSLSIIPKVAIVRWRTSQVSITLMLSNQSLASLKSRLVSPFWYRLTQVVLKKWPLNGCGCSSSGSSSECRGMTYSRVWWWSRGCGYVRRSWRRGSCRSARRRRTLWMAAVGAVWTLSTAPPCLCPVGDHAPSNYNNVTHQAPPPNQCSPPVSQSEYIAPWPVLPPVGQFVQYECHLRHCLVYVQWVVTHLPTTTVHQGARFTKCLTIYHKCIAGLL